MKKMSLVALAVASLVACGHAGAITLMQAYEAAMQNDPAYRMAKFDRDAGKENAIIGRANMLPNVSASYGANRNRADIDYGKNLLGEEVIDHPVYDSRSTAVQLRQSLFSVEGYARYKQGIAQANYSEAQFDLQTSGAVLRLVGAYCDVLFFQEQLKLMKAQRDALLEQRKVNDRLFDKGEGTRTDKLETQARLDLAEAQVLEAEDTLKNARTVLSSLIGRDVDVVQGLSSNFKAHRPDPFDFEQWRELALKNNPELQAQTYAIESSRQDVTRARGGHAPRLDLVASYSKSTSETLNTRGQDSTQRSIGVQLNIPLYAGGAVSASTRQAVAGLEKARAEMELRRDRILADLRKEFDGMNSNTTRLAALDKAVDSASLLVKATEQSIKGGVRINLDLLNAQQQHFTSLRDQAKARFEYLLGSLRLRAAAGTLNYADVKELAANFE